MAIDPATRWAKLRQARPHAHVHGGKEGRGEWAVERATLLGCMHAWEGEEKAWGWAANGPRSEWGVGNEKKIETFFIFWFLQTCSKFKLDLNSKPLNSNPTLRQKPKCLSMNAAIMLLNLIVNVN